MSKNLHDIAENLRDLVRDQMSNCTTNVTNSVIIQCVGTAIAYAIPLPSAEVTEMSPEDHFNSFHRYAVTRLIEGLNEEFQVDTAQILRVAIQLWLFRYRMVFTPVAINGILHVLANASGLYPEFVQEGVAEFQKSAGQQVATQEQYNDCTNTIFKLVNLHLNQKD